MNVEIDDKLKEYLDDVLYKYGAEAYYCGGISLDLGDYQGAIKSIINSLHFERCLNNGNPSVDIPFPEGIKEKMQGSTEEAT